MKDLGATKVIVTGSFKSSDDYTKAIMDATDGICFIRYILIANLLIYNHWFSTIEGFVR